MRDVTFQFTEGLGDVGMARDLGDNMKVVRHRHEQHWPPSARVLGVFRRRQQGTPCLGIVEVMQPSPLVAESYEQWVVFIDPIWSSVAKGVPVIEGHSPVLPMRGSLA